MLQQEQLQSSLLRDLAVISPRAEYVRICVTYNLTKKEFKIFPTVIYSSVSIT